MKITSKWSMLLAFAMALAGVQLFTTTNAHAQSSYFTSRGCANCHSAPVASTCAGCHQHSGTLTATPNKATSYAPGETVTVTLTASGARTGWIGARLYNQTGAEIARSSGNQSGMGGSTLYPAVLSAPAPATAGAYTWRVAYFGNNNGTGSGDVHSEKSVNVSVTVASAADTAAPTVGAFTLPATSTSLTVPVSSFTASDNTAVTGYLVTTSATKPLASAAGWTATAPTSVTAPAAGNVTFYAWAKDAAGNVSASRSASVVITITVADITLPTVGAFTLPATSTSLTVPVSSLTASDNIGVTGYLVTTSATKPLASVAGWTTAAPTSVTAPAAGTVTFYAWAKDAAGNVSASRSASVVITITVVDTTLPTVGAFTLPATSTSLTVPVSSFTASDNIGVTGYLVTTSATKPLASAAGWSATAPTSVTAPAAGIVTFYAWAKDAAGNVSASRSASVNISTAPAADTINPNLSISTLANGAVTNNPTLNVSGNATDNVALQSVKVNGTSVQLDASGNFTTAVVLINGANVITVVATDTAGNSTTIARTITYATSAPALSVTAPVDNLVSAQGNLVVEGIVTEHSTVTIRVNSGSPQVASLSGNTFTASIYLRRGLNTIDIKSVDAAGNISNAKRTVLYDNSNPTVAITEPREDKIVSDPSLTIKGRVADSLSKVAVEVTMDGSVYKPVVREGRFEQRVTFTTSKQYTIKATATDEAGNSVSVNRNVIYRGSSSDDSDDHDDSYDHDDSDDDDSEDSYSSSSSVVLPKPQLSYSVNGLDLAINWNAISGATGYTLYYAPVPYTGPESIRSMNMGSTTEFDITLWRGAAFFIAVEAYNTNGRSGYSNIETVMIR